MGKVKAACALILVSVFAVKVYETPILLTVDFPTLLSLLLGFFSVALAALFYFKATDTSNTFYDNTHKFTRDIAQLLVKIESGFGEKLKHLDEGYVAMRNQLQNSPYSRESSNLKETRADIKAEKEEMENVLKERNALIDELVRSSQLEAEAKDKIVGELKQKEFELDKARRELARMNRKLFVKKIEGRVNEDIFVPGKVQEYTEYLINTIFSDQISMAPNDEVAREFDMSLDSISGLYIDDLKGLGFYDSGLTRRGASYIKKVARGMRGGADEISW